MKPRSASFKQYRLRTEIVLSHLLVKQKSEPIQCENTDKVEVDSKEDAKADRPVDMLLELEVGMCGNTQKHDKNPQAKLSRLNLADVIENMQKYSAPN